MKKNTQAKKAGGLTAKQKKFCNEYLIDLNATQAAIRTGYSEKTANEQGARLLANVSVSDHIFKLQQKQQIRTEITADMVIQELARIGFHDIKDFVNGGNNVLELKNIDSDKTRAVAGVKTTINEGTGAITTELKFHNKVAALEKLGQHLGIFEKDNKQKQGLPAVILLPSNDRDQTAPAGD